MASSLYHTRISPSPCARLISALRSDLLPFFDHGKGRHLISFVLGSDAKPLGDVSACVHQDGGLILVVARLVPPKRRLPEQKARNCPDDERISRDFFYVSENHMFHRPFSRFPAPYSGYAGSPVFKIDANPKKAKRNSPKDISSSRDPLFHGSKLEHRVVMLCMPYVERNFFAQIFPATSS